MAVGQQLLDDGRADEDRSEGVVGVGGGGGEEGQGEQGLEGLGLASEVVAVHAHVEAADQFLAALLGAVGGLGEEDEAGAGAPGWFALDPVGVLLERVDGKG